MTKYKSEIGNYLDGQNIDFEEIILEQEVHSVSDVANVLNCRENEVLKALVFKGVKFDFLVILNGTSKIQKEKLELLLNQKIKFANKEKVLEMTGFEVGAVSPFIINNHNNIKIFADNLILNNKQYYLGSGVKNILLRLRKDEFLNTFNGTFIDI